MKKLGHNTLLVSLENISKGDYGVIVRQILQINQSPRRYDIRRNDELRTAVCDLSGVKHFRDPNGKHVKHSLVDTFFTNAASAATHLRESMYQRDMVVVVNYLTFLSPHRYTVSNTPSEFDDYSHAELNQLKELVGLNRRPDLIIANGDYHRDRVPEGTVLIRLKHLEDADYMVDANAFHNDYVAYLKLRNVIGTGLPSEED